MENCHFQSTTSLSPSKKNCLRLTNPLITAQREQHSAVYSGPLAAVEEVQNIENERKTNAKNFNGSVTLLFCTRARTDINLPNPSPSFWRIFIPRVRDHFSHFVVCAASLRPSFTLTTPVSRSLWLVFNITLISLDFQRCWFVLSFLLKYFFSLPSSL